MANNKVVFGDEILMDLTNDTVTPSDVAQGKTFHDKSGAAQTGSLVVIQPKLHIESEAESVVTVETSTGSIIVPTQISSGIWECNLPAYGTYIVHSVLDHEDKSTSVVVDEIKMFFVEIYHIPDGKTVLPTDDIQIWLKCAGIRNKNYTTLDEVLADSNTLFTLINNNNAIDYMVRSTTWISIICADETAMSYIGANNYAADTLLDDADWSMAIGESEYVKNVLNVYIPVLTEDTPEVLYSSQSSLMRNHAYNAFDDNWDKDNNYVNNPNFWYANGGTNQYIGYDFENDVLPKYFKVRPTIYSHGGTYYYGLYDCKIQYSDDNSTWIDVGNQINIRDYNVHLLYVDQTVGKHRYWRLFCISTSHPSAHYVCVSNLQLYGRESVSFNIYSAANDTIYYLDENNQPVVLCTTDSTGLGKVVPEDMIRGEYTLYSSVAKDPNNLSNDYSKLVNILDTDKEVYIMPDNVLYWWGYESSELEDCTTANGWVAYDSSFSLVSPTHNTNNITTNASSKRICAVANKTSLTSDKTVKAIVQGISGVVEYGWINASNQKIAAGGTLVYQVTTTSMQICSGNVNNGYYICVGCGNSRQMNVFAIWFE